jgi:hypothetical protein
MSFIKKISNFHPFIMKLNIVGLKKNKKIKIFNQIIKIKKCKINLICNLKSV